MLLITWLAVAAVACDSERAASSGKTIAGVLWSSSPHSSIYTTIGRLQSCRG
jgi:hypothetical protein